MRNPARCARLLMTTAAACSVAAIAVAPGAAMGAGCAPGFQDAGAGICTATFVYTGAPETVTLPPAVSVITAAVSGAEGGTSLEEQVDPFGGAASPGGKGGRETATIAVTGGATLTVVVGQAGTGGMLAPPGYGGYGGGGHATSRYGGNGGGGSYVFDDAGVLVAAGGGGGGGYDYNPVVMGRGDQHNPGGNGSGAEAAGDGQSVPFCCDGTAPYDAGGGGGATPASGGIGGHPTLPASYAFGQADGDAGYGPAIDAYNFGYGGSTHNGCCSYTGWAGGGGGGYYGGGGGGNIEAHLEGGGGGGGAGYVIPGAFSALSAVGVQVGDGEVILSYDTAQPVLPTPTVTPVAATPTVTPVPATPTATATASGPTPTESVATPTATPTAPVATPTPSVPDHFTCYTAAASRGSVKFAGRADDVLSDEFGTSTVAVKVPKYLCAPTNKLGESPGAPTHPEHLESYGIKPATAFVKITNRMVVDQFNAAGLHVDVKKPAYLLVPTVKMPGGPTPPLPGAFTTDHFQCYKASVTAKTPKFVAVPGVTLQDQFGPLTVAVQKPQLFCAPVDENGADPTAPQHAAHLLCYKIKQTDVVKFVKRTGLFLNNQFGPEELDAKKPSLLCVVATAP